ncbi:MAG: hypothetical protein IT445_17700 [Phycisphaeraceae bacterium]|nr:hypothetical protein [Phycisphaeraceae bacterium]
MGCKYIPPGRNMSSRRLTAPRKVSIFDFGLRIFDYHRDLSTTPAEAGLPAVATRNHAGRIFDFEIHKVQPSRKSSIKNQKSPRWRVTDPIGPDPPRAQQGDTTS